MTDLTPQQQYEAHRPLVEQVVASTLRQYCLVGDDADEFRSTVHRHLVDQDYGVFRKFRGNSSLRTYLVAVVKNQFRDFHRAHKSGRWRPSMKARRLGPLAVRMETLLYRDGRSREEAFQILRNDPNAPSANALAGLAAELPPRRPRRMEDPAALTNMTGADPADALVLDEERSASQSRLCEALERAMATLPDDDRVILRMRYADGFTVARIARSLGMAHKPLYHRIDRHLAHLRHVLEEDGVSATEVKELLA